MIKGKDLLSLMDFTAEEIRKILDLADILKGEAGKGVLRPLLAGKSLAMIFEKPSTRTRVSFHIAMQELGGYSIELSTGTLQVSRGETLEDTAKVLSRYVDVLMARVYDHRTLTSLAEAADIPVINGLSNLYHPCQILADLQTLRERKGALEGLKLAYVGDGNNVANSLLIGCAKMGVDISVATPVGYEPRGEAVKVALEAAQSSGSEVEVIIDPEEAVRDADAVYTDVWVSMGDEEEREERLKAFSPRYRVDKRLMSLAKPDAVFMHCLPMHRGEEVSSEVADGPQSIVWDQAENRLHAQKALLTLLLIDEEELPWRSLRGKKGTRSRGRRGKTR